jgi:ribose transport system substrate-binding protein
VTIGIVAKSQSNPVFQAAHAGAKAAQKNWDREDVILVVDIQTPADEDPMAQAAAVEQLARNGADGIAVACSDANTLRPAIDKAVELGVTVMTFDSDSPGSRRLLYYGTDDLECGRQIMVELARALDGHGTIAILAGNQAAPNLQNRVKGVLDELKNHPGMRLLADGVFFHPETPEQAAEAVNRAQTTHPDIQGWAFVGGWPLYVRDALRWEPGSIKVVSVDALPAQLTYLESGHVDVLLAQDCFSWGETSVDILTRRVLDGYEPPSTRMIAPLKRVTKADVAAYRKNWERWLDD